MLAAINEVAGGFKKPVNATQQSELLSEARVNPNMQRDLVSHASRPADMRDFQDEK